MLDAVVKYIGATTLVFAASMAGSFDANAQVQAISRDCDGCSVQQMDRVATDVAHGLKMPSERILYVFNWSSNTTRKYSLMRDREGGLSCDKMIPGAMECEPFIIVDNLPTEQQAIDYLIFRSVTAQADVRFTSPEYPSNAFDDISNPQKRQAVSAHLERQFEAYIYIASGASSLGINIFAPVTINYADGSKGHYNYNMQTRRWEPNALMYRDRFGNSIPLSLTQLNEGRGGVQTRFEFPGGSPEDIGSFVNSLNNLGIDVPGSGRVVRCTSIATVTDVQVTCTRGD